MKISFEKLFSEFKIKGVTLRNRIVFLPHYTALATMDSLPSERELYYYGERAKGGVGLIISGNYAVSKMGQMHRTFIDASNEEIIPGFLKITKMVHKYGAKIIAQITHAGPTKMEKPQPDLWAPSQFLEGSSRTHTVKMDHDDIRTVIEDFVKTSSNILKSGFDGIEIKVGHDGLLRTFISTNYNNRDDEYGGSFENRMRFIVEIFSAVRELLNKNTPLGVRLSMDEFEDGGYTLKDGIKIAKYLEQKKLIDYINPTVGTFWKGIIMMMSPMAFPLGWAEYLSAALKKETSLPVIAFSRINDPIQAEMILQNESADLIGMVRQLICDPETPNKARKGKLDEIRKCTGCLDYCSGQCGLYMPLRCVHNPSVGKEKILGIGTLKKAASVKKIIIIGGGVAGMKAAEIAAKRGHSVILFEKENILGGQINYVKKIPFRSDYSEILRYLEYQVKNNERIELRMGIEASESQILKEVPDVIIIATGARAIIPEKYFNQKVCTVIDILSDKVKIGKNVVIFDRMAKTEGVGIAEYLCEYNKGLNIGIWTPVNYCGEDIHRTNLELINKKLMTYGVNLFPFHDLVEVKNNKITFINVYSQKEKSVKKYDNLIYIGESISVDDLYWKLKGKIKEVYRLGDCRSPRLVELALSTAEELARNL